ncbi:MAG: peptide chain release factor aRF-1 [Sulfolobales archaeon]|nr:peptide chain release factor aRF-1 [Sulfolobales archaeon]MCX8199680.1 peptide chain release factor aRF-1 [Sulfolobales archaeon]
MDKHSLRNILAELRKWKAPATVLLSLYVPPERPISDVLNLLRQELSITDNIKLKKTKNAVQRALTATIDRLSKILKVPEKGLAVFCGENMDTGDFICITLSPPEPVPVFFYRTDKEFHLEFLEPMVEESNVIGLIIVERDAATIGLLKGNRLKVLDELEDYIPGKHAKGGQSQRRYDRVIEQMVHEFYKRVGERVKEYFEPYLESGKLKAVLLGGPAYAKYDFLEGDYLDYRLKQILIPKFIDVAYQGEVGLREMIIKANDVLKEQQYLEALKAIDEFKLHLVKDDGLTIYGDDELRKALEIGAVEKLIVSEERNDLEEWIELAKRSNAKTIVINDEIPEGVWINKTFGGAVGILRYRLF